MTKRARARFTIAAAVAVLLASPAAASHAVKPVPPVTITATPDHQEIIAGLPCLPAPPIELGMTNNTDEARYADTLVRGDAALELSRGMFSSYLPAGQTVTAPLSVSAPYGTTPGDYAVTLESGRQELRIPISVSAPPDKGPGDNLLRGEHADPSSTYVTSSTWFSPCGGVDGDRTWSTTTAWNSATRGEFPDTYTVTLPKAVTMNRTDLYTLDTSAGLRDWDVRVMTSDRQWQTVAQVRGNTAGHVVSRFAPVEAEKVQIVGLDSNRHDYSRIIEVEAYLE